MIKELEQFIKQFKEDELEDVLKSFSLSLLELYYDGRPSYKGICLNNELRKMKLCNLCQNKPVDKLVIGERDIKRV